MNKKTVSIVMSALLLMSATSFAFSDISNHWAEMDIKKLSENKLLSGYEDGTFRPDNLITREEVAQIFSNQIGENYSPSEIPNDAKGRWSSNAIEKVMSKGLVFGYPDGSFQPTNNITRAEMALITYRYLESAGTLYNNFLIFPDVNSDDWFRLGVSIMGGNGIISGYPDGNFEPNKFITRAEAAKIIVNSENPEPIGFDDEILEFPDAIRYYILFGQDDVPFSDRVLWLPEFLDNISDYEMISLFISFLNAGGNPDNVKSFAIYLSYHASVYENWQDLIKSSILENFGETVTDIVHVESQYYNVYVEGRDTPFVTVNSITGYYHG